MSFGMFLLIGYLVISLMVATAFYTACIMAARVEEAEQQRNMNLLSKRQMMINALRSTQKTQRLQPHLA